MVTAIETISDAALCVKIADDDDLRRIYRARHDVYALELAQHQPNSRHELTDALDGHNVYLCVNRGDELAGFVSITAPGGRYSIDKYLSRDQVPLAFDDRLYEVRLLTVLPERRGRVVALLLMFAALQWIESHGGDVVKFAGDALLAIWPVEEQEQGLGEWGVESAEAQPTDGALAAATLRAAQCALAINVRISSLYRLIAGAQLTLRIGVAAGAMATVRIGGVYGRWEFLVSGAPLAAVAAAR